MSRTRQAIGAFCALLVFALCASGCADILGFQAGKPFPPDTSSIDASADVSVDGSDGNREGGSGGADSGGTKEAGGDCTALDNPANGLVTVPTLTLGSMATYSCILGAQLMDSPTRPIDRPQGRLRRCSADDLWGNRDVLVQRRVRALWIVDA
jgi:hypothetical protein